MLGRRRPKTDAVSFEAMLKDFDDRWAASKLTRPSHFGDGRPFEPDPLVAELRDVFWRSIHLPDAQGAAEYQVLMLLMVALQDLKNVDSDILAVRLTSFVVNLRKTMVARGAAEDADTVSRFALYLVEYWESATSLDAGDESTHGQTAAQ